MLPITRVPATIANGMAKFRALFCREEGFEHVSRYVTGLIMRPNKTLQGIYDLQVWDQQTPSRRALHAGVFEAGWDDAALMQRHRAEVAGDYRGRGRAVMSLDWTLVHHERIDGLDGMVQDPLDLHAEEAYLHATAKTSYEQMIAGRQRLLELLHHQLHRRLYRKRTELVIDIVRQLEAEGQFPQADYAFDNGGLTVDLPRFIEHSGKHWVSELESVRAISTGADRGAASTT